MVPPIVLALTLLLPSGICPGLSRPVSGNVLRSYAPVGSYAGHWGLDFAAVPGSVVLAADGGEVTFAGQVAGILSVTVHHGGGLRTSYSYLSEVAVAAGQMVGRADVLGHSGVDHGIEAVHFSVRLGDDYTDPEPWLRCWSAPAPGLSLAPVPSAYPAPRATRNPRRYIRSPSPGSLVCRRSRLSRSWPRHSDISPGRSAVAESRSPGHEC